MCQLVELIEPNLEVALGARGPRNQRYTRISLKDAFGGGEMCPDETARWAAQRDAAAGPSGRRRAAATADRGILPPPQQQQKDCGGRMQRQ